MSSALFERPTSGYPGYDLEEVMFDMDDPDFDNMPTNPIATMAANAKIRGIHIRQSKSDSILQLSTSQSYYRFENIENFNKNNLNYHNVFTIGWTNTTNNCLNSLGLEELDSETQPNSIDDLNGSGTDTNMLTIEGLRTHYNSCFTCGVCWQEEHVSLDCSECGGYSMLRPCPKCEGQCKNVWTRDLAGSHKAHKAKWQGDCKLYNENDLLQGLLQRQLSPETCDNLLSKALDQLNTPL